MSEIILDNYSSPKNYIYWDRVNFGYLLGNKSKQIVNGDGGFTEDGELVGLFLQGENLIFIWNTKEYIINTENFKCTNVYIDKAIRYFEVITDNYIICEYNYKPFLNPNYPFDGSEEDEFDFLLYLSNNIMKDKESIHNFKRGMKRIKDENIIL